MTEKKPNYKSMDPFYSNNRFESDQSEAKTCRVLTLDADSIRGDQHWRSVPGLTPNTLQKFW